MIINVAVVGVGCIGIYHAEKYANLKDCNLAYVVDTDEIRGREVAQKFSTKYLSCYKELVGKISAVSIAVNTSKHWEIAKFFLLNNIHVLLEKPFTNNIVEAIQLKEIADKKNLILMAGYCEKFNPFWNEIKKLITSPIFIYSNRVSIYNNRCTDINVIQDLMSHDINIIQSFIANKIKSISLLASSYLNSKLNFCSVKVIFEGDICAVLVASRMNNYNARNFFIHQRTGNISIDFLNKTAIFTANNGENIVIQINDHDNIKHEISMFINYIKNKKSIIINNSAEAIKTLFTIKEIEEKILL